MTVAGGAQVETPGTWPSVETALPRPPYAAWGRRVLASVLDGALGSGVAFLALGAPSSSLPFLGAWFDDGQNRGITTWTNSGWSIGTVLAALVMQAYLGATPGKLVMGLAVVREADARPIGLLRTAIRYVLHIVDAFFFVGFLRPLWNAECQTFADSLASTVVLHTRRPRAHRRPVGPSAIADPGPPIAWESPSVPRWLPAATTLSAVACAVGLAFAWPIGSSGPMAGRLDLDCVMTSAAPGPLSLTGGAVAADLYPATQTRLGVTRHTAPRQAPVVTWQMSGTSDAATDATLRVSFTSADGTASHSYDFSTVDGGLGPTTETRTLPSDALDDFAPSWTWRQTVVVDGVESPACTGSITVG